MAGAAQAVHRLAGAVGERIDSAGLVESGERAVDGREPDARPAAAQAIVELLRGCPVRVAAELGQHGQPLGGRPEPQLREE